jgi:hypothetical protein
MWKLLSLAIAALSVLLMSCGTKEPQGWATYMAAARKAWRFDHEQTYKAQHANPLASLDLFSAESDTNCIITWEVRKEWLQGDTIITTGTWSNSSFSDLRAYFSRFIELSKKAPKLPASRLKDADISGLCNCSAFVESKSSLRLEFSACTDTSGMKVLILKDCILLLPGNLFERIGTSGFNSPKSRLKSGRYPEDPRLL